jgi:hypothetical protein
VETFDSLMLGFSVALRPDVLWYAFLGCIVGTLVGMLPGIGPLAGISILLAADLRARRHQGHRDAGRHLLRLAVRRLDHVDPAAHSRRAASVMTCIDGNAMAQKAAPARRSASPRSARSSPAPSASSCSRWSRRRSPPSRCGSARRNTPRCCARPDLPRLHVDHSLSAPADGGLRLLLGTIGIDVMSGHFRYSFDIPELGDGIGIVPVAVGLFGLGEILATPSHR